jgi:4-hydroxy 2-oxovalerate aldolase
MGNVQILDCTLRDGGFINDWDFGDVVIRDIIARLDGAKIDIIEIGYLKEAVSFDPNRTIFPGTSETPHCLTHIAVKNAMLVAIVDYGACSIDRIDVRENSILDGIRVTFKKNEHAGAIAYSKQIMEKGYRVFLQPVSITSYTETELLDLIQRVNQVKPFAFSIVDTYGLMFKEDLIYYFYLINRNLDRDIRIGYHSHNNYQIAFSNCLELLHAADPFRHIILDASLYGMGKSAGNAQTELLANYLNSKFEKSYDLNQLLEAIESYIMPIYRHAAWGYRIEYFIAAAQDCHPNYVQYLIRQGTLSIESINLILQTLPPDKKLNYSQETIEALYLSHQFHDINDKEACDRFAAMVQGKSILILAPGKSIVAYEEHIQEYVQRKSPVVIAVNFIPNNFSVHGVFVSNAKRYALLPDAYSKYDNKPWVLATSNIFASSVPVEFTFNLKSLMPANDAHLVNSTLLLLNLLKKIDFSNPVAIAGFDGYDTQQKEAYAISYMHSPTGKELSAPISEQLARLDKMLHIRFLTPTNYLLKGACHEPNESF